MKGRSHAAGDYRLDLTAVAAAILQIALLAGCGFLDRSGIALDHRFTVSATIQSGDGRRSVVSSENLAEFSPDVPPLFGGGWSSEELVTRSYTSYLNEVLDARGGEAAFQDLYGRGPWCVLDVHVARTDVVIEEDEEDDIYAGSDPLPVCDCGEACRDNVPPVQGVLSIAPTEPARPNVVDFGPVDVLSPRELEVTLHNVGDGFLCLNAPQVDASSSEHPGDYSVAPISGCEAMPEGLVLEAGTECRLRATFTPREPGPRSARIPTLRGCGASLTLEGVGVGGSLTASPAPACFAGETCTVVPIRIQNTSVGIVSLSATSLTDAQPGGWELLRLYDTSGTTVSLSPPYQLTSGQSILVEVQACALATTESALRVTHNGSDYGAPGSPTGDVDAGSPLVVRLRPRSSGCTP
jgi:hypothetical protein